MSIEKDSECVSDRSKVIQRQSDCNQNECPFDASNQEKA